MRNLFLISRSICLALLLLTFAASRAGAQKLRSRLPNTPDDSFSCFPVGKVKQNPKGSQPLANTGYNPHGYDITARGELRILLVYAGFTNDINQGAPGFSGGTWPQTDPAHPVPGTSFPANSGGGFYTSASQFSSSATDQTVSNFYYQMSQFSANPLRMYATVFPKRINVTANDATSGNGGFVTGGRLI